MLDIADIEDPDVVGTEGVGDLHLFPGYRFSFGRPSAGRGADLLLARLMVLIHLYWIGRPTSATSAEGLWSGLEGVQLTVGMIVDTASSSVGVVEGQHTHDVSPVIVGEEGRH
jgi:hypothetical protein